MLGICDRFLASLDRYDPTWAPEIAEEGTALVSSTASTAGSGMKRLRDAVSPMCVSHATNCGGPRVRFSQDVPGAYAFEGRSGNDLLAFRRWWRQRPNPTAAHFGSQEWRSIDHRGALDYLGRQSIRSNPSPQLASAMKQRRVAFAEQPQLVWIPSRDEAAV